MACLSAVDAPASSFVVVWLELPSHRTTGVCLRLLAIDEVDVESLTEEAEETADLAIGMSLWSGETGRLRGASDDERGASNDERGVEKSESSLDLTGERVPGELATIDGRDRHQNITFAMSMSQQQQPPSLPSVLRPEPAVRDSKHITRKIESRYTQTAT